MDRHLKAIEKLLNTLGTKRLESLYGLKGYKFFVDEFIPQNQFHGGNIIVRTEPKLPITLSIKGEDVGMGKYSNLARLGTNLTSLLKYFEGSGSHKPYILINPEDFKILEDPFKLLPSGKTSFIDHPKRFKRDPETRGVVLIGEIGGTAEEEAAEYIRREFDKPVIAFIAGQTAPPGRRMGHAGAIISGGQGKAKDKINALQAAGITVAVNLSTLGKTVLGVMGKI